jgi:hypothetical protein
MLRPSLGPRQMLDPLDPLIYEFCFPGGLTGETEISCPLCKTLLTVPVNDPLGEESYLCCQCQKGFVVDWANGQVTADLPPLNVATFRERISGGGNQGRSTDATKEEVHCGADHREAPRG